jgi:NTE family protein
MSKDISHSVTPIGLALSGGGVRAVAFHAGVLRYLAEQGLLERIAHVSSVSGGSLFVGLLFKHGEYSWPTSESYLNEVLPQVRKILTTNSLQRSAILRLVLNPLNWRFILSRASVMAQAIRKLWGIDIPLSRLTDGPIWSINCTTGETGRRFRFKNRTMGDYELGYADVESFSLAKAMAISAAFPGGVGPLAIHTNAFDWRKRAGWGDGMSDSHKQPFDTIHLYDGGLYDNLGIEPLFDVGAQVLKKDESMTTGVGYLLVSDGGAPLPREGIPHSLNPFRFKRIADIALDQCRALRVRSFMNFLQGNPSAGAFVGIGAGAVDSITRLSTGREERVKELLHGEWLASDDAKRAATYSTTLGRLKLSTFDLVERHGYETTKWNLELLSRPPKPVS